MNAFFKALNDQTRRDILDLLRDRDMTAGEIADQFSFSKPTISLRQAGLVESVKQGQFIYYSLNTTVMDEILTWFVKLSGDKGTSKIKPKK
jgi:ArsR family transcriptional regulator, arsenate/arsenite/antimonite-responsive transcriptional repressor